MTFFSTAEHLKATYCTPILSVHMYVRSPDFTACYARPHGDFFCILSRV